MAWGVGVYAYLLQCLFVRRALAHERANATGWLLGGALVSGTGMWALTMLSLVAWDSPIPVGYAAPVVLAAWLPSVVLVAALMWQFSVQGLDWRVRALGGLFIALGLSTLSLVAQSAIVTTPSWSWRLGPALGATTVYLASGLFASVATRRVLYGAGGHGRLVAISAVVAAAFVAGNVWQMQTLSLPPGAVCLSLNGLSRESVHTLASTIVVLFMISAHMVTVYDERAQGQQAVLRRGLEEARVALQRAAEHDPASGLLNRHGFERRLADLLQSRAAATEGVRPGVTVARLGLDGFRAVIESYGQAVGDQFVRTLAEIGRAHV